jgi:hypothetical protein
MELSASRWHRRLLLLACGGYWLALTLVLIGPPLIAGWRVTRPEAGHGVINASLDGTMLRIAMSGAHTAPWNGSISVWTLAFWIVCPPLVLWLALLGIQKRNSASPLRSIHR